MADAALNTNGIEIRGLYKIFGSGARQSVPLVQQGMSKAALLEWRGHVLGLKDINLSVPGGCFQVIMGLSGSGKSTLIRHVNRLIDPTAGDVVVGGADVVQMGPAALREFRRRQTAMVFQKFALLPHRNVLGNVVYGLEIQGVPKAKQVDAAMRWIDRVGLRGFERHFPNQLSGGMQQRVGLARALTNDAPILLMDEAFSALDPLIRMDMQSVLLDLQKEVRKTIIFITHDLDEALRLGDQIAILRDGEIIQQGSGQDIVLSPADEYIARFVREVNRGRVLSAAAFMSPIGGGGLPSLPIIPADMCLEDTLRLLNDAGQRSAHVAGPQGEPAGVVTVDDIVAAILTPSAARVDTKIRATITAL